MCSVIRKNYKTTRMVFEIYSNVADLYLQVIYKYLLVKLLYSINFRCFIKNKEKSFYIENYDL